MHLLEAMTEAELAAARSAGGHMTLLSGTAVNQDGRSSSLTVHPNMESQCMSASHWSHRRSQSGSWGAYQAQSAVPANSHIAILHTTNAAALV